MIFLSEHPPTALYVAACRWRGRIVCRRRQALVNVNEPVEAKDGNQLGRVLVHWSRYDLFEFEGVGYVPPTEIGAEPLLHVITGRTECSAVILTTDDLPPLGRDAGVSDHPGRCCEIGSPTGSTSLRPENTYRFRRMPEARQKK